MPRTVFTSPQNGTISVKRFIELLQENIKTGLIDPNEDLCVYDTAEDCVSFDVTLEYVSGNLTLRPR